jgi:hypothetical protein
MKRQRDARHEQAQDDAGADGAEADHAALRAHDSERNACGCAHCDLPRLRDRTSDPHESLAISLMRFVFAGYVSGRIEGWDHGFEAAAQVLGHEAGAMVFSRVLTLGRALKAERQGTFRFMPVHCTRISEDEVELLQALQTARGPDPGRFEQALLVLSRQGKSPRLHAALTGLAGLIGLVADDSRQLTRADPAFAGVPGRLH